MRGQVTFSDCWPELEVSQVGSVSQLTDCSNEDVNIPSKTEVMAPSVEPNKFLVVCIALVETLGIAHYHHSRSL